MKLKAIVLLFLFIAPIGCASVKKELPAELMYHPPVASNDTATIVGSNKEEWMFEEVVYVMDINGKRLAGDKKHWDDPVVIDEGKTVVTAAFDGKGIPVTAKVEFEAVAGHSYQIQFLSDIEEDCCDFWIIDMASEKAVSTIGRGYAPKKETIYVPLPVYWPRVY